MKTYTMTTEEANKYDGNDIEVKDLHTDLTERFTETTEVYHPEGFVAWVLNT